MGVSGTLDYFSELLSSVKKVKKRKQLNTVALKVRMDCEGCKRQVKNTLSSLKGVKSVDVDLKEQKVTVSGFVDEKKVLKKAQSTGKKSEPWPYVPYNLIAHPYAAQVYDKKAPRGFVRATEDTAIATFSTVEQHYTTMFSDDNPNACSIM
ncbi:Heavy metal-associated isoprenylated plant protein 24 [Camellia lanceoleosa]|uniref:Heavy metal-associated isoprenylated plant protein 24 n=1 Tax=Camellia lanceoleosa TaxID=1840588 RepID=A0ACC0HJR6_9ERIC|nr:Heavy metal-associated isoprenylated plant protein 24 [Camellia lanceoleosa]